MKKQPTPWELGATLYMPATRKDIAEVVLEGKIPALLQIVGGDKLIIPFC